MQQIVNHVRHITFTQELLKYTGRIHHQDFNRVASTYGEFKKQKGKSQKEEIFIAINQLRNYVIYEVDRFIEYTEIPEYIRFFFPIIVFDGKLYECTIENTEPRLQEINHVLLRHWYPDGIFYFDIVKREYFREFLKKIKEERDRIYNNVNKNYQEIIEIGEKIKEAMRRSRK
ncbi:hypothetical protein [Candidatus Borrarchaeum sp.]|uniref:hypothetical protein n=1 Tax=Candidatus Borrarchaeum sp. TaxID=2846742 RepID=UPI00257D7B0C|nr:hypothetical protein [Candidatus Borrarchaeum sp.]